jgi:uncharacterized protein (DUF58 family)
MPLVALDLVILLVAVADGLAARGNIEVSRVVAEVQAVGRQFPVELEVSNLGRRFLQLRVTDDPPGVAIGLPTSFALRAGEVTRCTYDARVDDRGAHDFGPITVRWRSPLGLWERQRSVRAEQKVRVYPNFEQLRNHGLKARAEERRLPVRARRRAGGENEFQRLRPYVAGDPYKHIDWRATARRQKFVTREFGQESNQNLIFLLDCGRLMTAQNGELSQFDHALNAALMLGQSALRHGDRVGLLAFDHKVRVWMPPKGGAKSGARLIRGTYDLFPTLNEPDYGMAFRHLGQRVRRRSLVVLLTAVVDEANAKLTQQLVHALSSRHLAVAVWLRDVDMDEILERPAASDEDRFLRGAAAELVGWRERTLEAVRRTGALVVDVPPDQLTGSLLSRYMEIKARRLL